jgi:hypothetical protein
VTRQEARKQDSGLGLATAEEYKRSAGEDFKCDYSETATVISNCKFRLVYNQWIEHEIRNPLIIWHVTKVTRHNIDA